MMQGQRTSQKPKPCYLCQNQTGTHCGYCLLPLCAEHGKDIRPWFTSRIVMVCLPCQATLETIARQEYCLDEQQTPRRLRL